MTQHSDFPTLAELDRDGALEEAGSKVDGVTRSMFMRRSAAFVGGTLAATMLPTALASASGGIPASDIAILNYALTLEYLESAFYAEAVAKKALSGETKKFASTVAGHEALHVIALQKTLGSQAVKKPTFNFKGTTANQSMFQKTAMVLEDTGVTAYLGQVGNIKTPRVLAAAGSILPVEARHAAWIESILGVSPAPDAFQASATMAQVNKAVKGTGFITG